MNALEYNYVLVSAIISWCAAQIIKTLIHFIQTKSFNPERLFGAGGMPSSHSALVCSATIAICRKCGFGSSEFALMFILAMIVMYDAMGVRRSAGLQAKEINRLRRVVNELDEEFMDSFDDKVDEIEEKKPEEIQDLKEFLGHTPLEVLCGALLGILIAMAVPIQVV